MTAPNFPNLSVSVSPSALFPADPTPLVSASGKCAILGQIRPQASADRGAPYPFAGTSAALQVFARRTPADLSDRAMNAMCFGEFSRSNPSNFHADLVLEGGSEKIAADLLDIYEFLADLIGSPAKAFDILDEFGVMAKTIVMENPYSITDVDGVGFKTADKAARQIWGEPFNRFREERLAAALALAIADKSLQSGSTVVSRVEAINTAMGSFFLDLPQVAETRALLAGIIPKLIKREKVAPHAATASVGLARFISAERSVASIVNAKLGASGPPTAWPMFSDKKAARRLVALVEKDLGFTLVASQTSALETLLTSSVAVLTGGPGTGKTTITKTYCDAHAKERNSVVLVAPTGRAAQRLAESTGREASTIHRAFQVGPGGCARVNASNPLQCNVLVVDEASMLDAGLARIVLNGVTPACHILFVGDVDQLPAIQPGNVLTDLLATNHVPRARLTETMRQAAGSHIIQAAKQFNAGQGVPKELSGENDFLYVEARTESEALDYVRRLMLEVFPQVDKKDGSPIDLSRDVQILATHNDKGEIARWNVSQFYSGIVNPGAERSQLRAGGNSKSSGFANPNEMVGVGDKVISLKNDYELGVMNGEIGFVVSMRSSRGTVDELTVEFDPNDDVVAFGDEIPDPRRLITFKEKTLKNVTCAGAITVHKSQGSQFPAVICLVPRSAGSFVSRRLIYTAMTRAQQFLALVCIRDSIDLASRETGTPRVTTLAHVLEQQASAAKAAAQAAE